MSAPLRFWSWAGVRQRVRAAITANMILARQRCSFLFCLRMQPAHALRRLSIVVLVKRRSRNHCPIWKPPLAEMRRTAMPTPEARPAAAFWRVSSINLRRPSHSAGVAGKADFRSVRHCRPPPCGISGMRSHGSRAACRRPIRNCAQCPPRKSRSRSSGVVIASASDTRLTGAR